MKNSKNQPGQQRVSECRRTRLAHGRLAAVDACECGSLHVHMGALTLRMAACALMELAATLNKAVAAHAKGSDVEARALALLAQPRGQA